MARPDDTPAARRWRIPAGDLEGLVLRQVRELLGDARQLRPILQRVGVSELEQLDALDRGALLAKELDGEPAADAAAAAAVETRTWLRVLLERVTVAEAEIVLTIREATLLQLLRLPGHGDAGNVELRASARLQRAGMEMRLVDERAVAPAADPTLIRLLAKAWAIRRDVLKAAGRPLAEIAAAHGVGDSYAGRLLRLGFLAPDIVEAIVTGTQPLALTANRLATLPEIPVDWPAQRALILGR